MPVVSPKAMRSAPSERTRSTMPATRLGSMSPSKGQPKLVATMTSTLLPWPWISSIRWVMSSSDSAVDRLRLRRLWVSLADTTTSISAKPASSARCAPRVFGISAEYRISGFLVIRAQTSSASAICGIAFGCTNETASIRFTPVPESASISRTLASVGIGSSFCRPSRGATSRIETCRRSSVHLIRETMPVS